MPENRLAWIISILTLGALGIGSVAGAHTGRPADEEPAVYRVRATVAEQESLRQDFDVWAYYPGEQIAIVLLDGGEKDHLEKLDFDLELDAERTHRHLSAARGETAGLKGGGIPGFPCYRTVEETFADLAAAAASHPGLASWQDIGDSWLKTVGQGGYDQRVLVLSNQQIPGPKPVFLLMAAMHAREYATAELATRFALHLLDGYGTDPEATWILDHREVHVLAQQNPDGRKQAETGILWRKNADDDHCTGSNDRGVDLNRNSTFFWGGSSSSGAPCSEIYRGPSAASEPETTSIEDYMFQVFQDQKGDLADPAPDDAEGLFISIHSFGELVLFPWEGTSTDSPNHAQLRTLGRRFGYFNDYSVCQDCLGTASGTTVDMAYGELGVAAYTFEVGNNFFESCAPFESTIYPDNLEALIYAAKVADHPYQKPSGPDALELALAEPQVVAGRSAVLNAALDDSRFDSGGFGTEPTQNVVAGRAGLELAALEAGGGTPVTVVDGVFDEVREDVQVSLDTSGLEPGRHLVYLIGQDASGQWGPPSAIFLEVLDAIFADGFETGDTSRWSSP